MGQYWLFINLDKRQCFCWPAKLGEFLFDGSPEALIQLFEHQTEANQQSDSDALSIILDGEGGATDSWIGDRIICLGDDPRTDLPKGLLSSSEQVELNEAQGDDGTEMGLFEFADTNFPEPKRKHSYLYSRTSPAQNSRMRVLRNLSKHEYVREDAIKVDTMMTLFNDTPQVERIGFGEVVLSRICWSAGDNCAMCYDGNIHRGVWAGDRFDITTIDQVEFSDGGMAWTDVSVEVANEITAIWVSEWGNQWLHYKMLDATPDYLHLPKQCSRHELPGFGLPLDFEPHEGRASYHWDPYSREIKHISHSSQNGPLYPNALYHESAPMRLTPLRELTMMRMMNQLTEKAEWNIKIFDDTTIAKWKAEALSAPDIDITERMFTWCIKELQYKAKKFQETGMITTYDGDIVKSDTTIPLALRSALKAAVAPLENVPEIYRDWDFDSNDIILDLVHPSLFPVVYGRTKILNDSVVGLDNCIEKCGAGVTLRSPSVYNTGRNHYNRKYQWLPCDVGFEDDRAKITSYINNLHPKAYKPLYEVIERIIELAIPLWNQTLTPLKSRYYNTPRISYDMYESDSNPDSLPEESQAQQLPNESDGDHPEQDGDWESETSSTMKPEPEDFAPPRWDLNDDGIQSNDEMRVDLKKDFSESGLQIIVKLANIHLTPEQPNYGGGKWHVEGRLNEHICATALYYYDSANITENGASFRQQSETTAEGFGFEHEHHDWFSEVFGCQQKGPILQYVGDVPTNEGRLITFPNVFQHRVLPFQLLDKTKLGHRKVLTLYLVDPHIRIISSANVPSQQREWWAQEIRGQGLFQTLPAEIHNEVIRHVAEFPIGIDEAKEVRKSMEKGFFFY